MILDERTEFCDATALNTGGAGTYLLGDQIDLTLARDIGRGEPIYFVISVAVLPVSADGTATFTLASDSTASIATNGSATVHAVSPTFLAAAMPAGRVLFAVALPMEGTVYERYLGVLQTTATTAFSAGAINAFLTHDVSLWKAYADASN
jgi:hypothetical protein